MVLISYWPLDGNADDARRGNNGSVNGATSSTSFLSSSFYSFDGASDYIEVPHDSSLNLDNQITLTAWVKPDSSQSSTRGTVITKKSEYYIQVKSDRTVAVYTYPPGSDSQYMNSNTTLSSGNWSHIAFTENSEGLRRIYINGELVKESSFESGIDPDNKPVGLGAETGGGSTNRFFAGDIAEARIYDHALTEQEIQYLYSVGSRGLHISSERSL